METYRLKNIVILILLLLNLFLLGLTVHLRLQQRHTAQTLAQQLTRLYENSGISLPEDLDVGAAALTPMTASRSLDDEAALAAYLLGRQVDGEDQGGGIYTYTGDGGAVQFRSSGAFDYAPALPAALGDPETFWEGFLETFGYRSLSSSFSLFREDPCCARTPTLWRKGRKPIRFGRAFRQAPVWQGPLWQGPLGQGPLGQGLSPGPVQQLWAAKGAQDRKQRRRVRPRTQ